MLNSSTPWHAESYTRFLTELLPRLLAERLPLTHYRVQHDGESEARLMVQIASQIDLVFQLPHPDARGVFVIDGALVVVLPLASSEALDIAEVRCVGEQLAESIAAQLGHAPDHLAWDAALAQAWLPLERWVRAFLTPRPDDFGAHQSTAQYLDQTNWLATMTHLRRIVIPQPQRLFTPGQVGRVCPFETPEGPNIGRIFTIALGAALRDGQLAPIDERPAATLGLSAACVPLLEHNEYPRQLMGVNMMRQWLPPPSPEPALVRSGHEPEHPAFWCGRNLLTAFITWDADTFEDGLVISESAARRLGYPATAEPGDKISNRHGAKGVISRIVPDREMPHLADGTPVELIVSFMSIPSRLNMGQVREAVLGRVARATGQPVVAPPFQAPDAAAIRALLRGAGLPEQGMETLTLGPEGPPLAQPSTVGWVYWGKLIHTAASKLQCFTGEKGLPRLIDELDAPDRTAAWPMWIPAGQLQGELEYYALRQAGAIETIREQYNTRTAARPDAATLADRLAAGLVTQAGPPTPMLAALQRRLGAASIQIELTDAGLAFTLSAPAGPLLELAQPIPHPWLPERMLAVVGALPELPEYHALVAANQRLAPLLASGAPDLLVRRAREQLAAAAQALFDTLVRPEHLTFEQATIFSARAVAAAGGARLRYDQVGLADEIAWALFGPLTARELGDRAAVQGREARAAHALDAVMARSWVLVGRSPSLQPEAFLAFRPVRIADQVVRLPSLGCSLLDADFDGDQVAVFLPITEAGQREAGERLSIAAHVARDPRLIGEVRPRMDSLLALAHLSLQPEGRAVINEAAGRPIPAPDGYVTRWSIADVLAEVLATDGASAALELSERLATLGFQAARRLGLSLSPFVGEGWGPPTPTTDDALQWERYAGEVEARLDAHRDVSGDFGGLVLAARTGARGNRRLLASLFATRYQVPSLYETVAPVRGNMRDGLRFEEVIAIVGDTRSGMAAMNRAWEADAVGLRDRLAPRGDGVLARAMRASRPGLVFALAAQAAERDPLRELSSRLFVGIAPDPA